MIGFQLASDWVSIGIQWAVNRHLIGSQSASIGLNWHWIGSQLAFHWQSIGLPLVVHWRSVGSQLTFQLQLSDTQLIVNWESIGIPLVFNWYCIGIQIASAWMSIGIPLVIDLHYIDTQLVSHWMSIDIRLTLTADCFFEWTIPNFNWQQIGIQLAMDWHRLYWIGFPYLPAYTSHRKSDLRPDAWPLG